MFGPQSLFRKGSLAADVLGGAEAGECAEVANHVRLIAIPAFEGEGWPIRYSASSNEHQRALKSSHATEQLRGDTDFLFEDRDKAALTQANLSRNLACPRCRLDAGGKGEDV